MLGINQALACVVVFISDRWLLITDPDGAEHVPVAVKELFLTGDGEYSALKRLLDNTLEQNAVERWSLDMVQRRLKLQVVKPLSVWLREPHTHRGKEMRSLYNEFFEHMSKHAGGDIDVSELPVKLPADKLAAACADSKKKNPVLKKLWLRLHVELEVRHFSLSLCSRVRRCGCSFSLVFWTVPAVHGAAREDYTEETTASGG